MVVVVVVVVVDLQVLWCNLPVRSNLTPKDQANRLQQDIFSHLARSLADSLCG